MDSRTAQLCNLIPLAGVVCLLVHTGTGPDTNTYIYSKRRLSRSLQVVPCFETKPKVLIRLRRTKIYLSWRPGIVDGRGQSGKTRPSFSLTRPHQFGDVEPSKQTGSAYLFPGNLTALPHRSRNMTTNAANPSPVFARPYQPSISFHGC